MTDPVTHIEMMGAHRLIIHTEVTIHAPAQTVWDTITDFDAIGAWSPHLKTVVGELAPGAAITAIYDFGGGTLLKNPVKLTWQDGKRFGWSGGTLYGPDVYDNHQFMVVPLDAETTRFVHTDDLTCTSPDIDMSDYIPSFEQFFPSFNAALKAHIESLPGG